MLVAECERLFEAAAPGNPTTTDRNPVNHRERARLTLAGKIATVKYAYLYLEPSDGLTLRLYPADTLDQARHLYTSPACVGGLLSLRNSGWHVRPNFHLGFMEKGFTWTTSRLDIDAYVRYWAEHPHRLREIRRPDWDTWLSGLIADGIFAPEDEAQFDTDFRDTRRQKAVPRPGVALSYSWEGNDTSVSSFATTLRSMLREALVALREPLATVEDMAHPRDTTVEVDAVASATSPVATKTPDWSSRERIPERVRHEVWRRDEGCCVDCGSRERLEFDHIIPISRGSSNTTRNIELRCERCNRTKGADI
jgi:HNH endonuclease